MGSNQVQRAVGLAKRVWFGRRGESIELGGHRLRYVAGTRPVRLKFRDHPDVTVRNDVRQLEYFCDNIRPGQTVLDVGANVGQYAVLFGSLVGPSGFVASFEPERDARALLELNVALNGLKNVRVEPLAIFDVAGEHSFYWRSGDQMSSLQRDGLGRNSVASDVRETKVQSISIDEYLLLHDLPAPHWLKIDVEGAEGHVLLGATRALAGQTQILCELHPYAWNAFGTTFEQIVSLAGAYGRTVRFLDPSRDITLGPEYGAVLISR
jgi:FkbM family methyltransferase